MVRGLVRYLKAENPHEWHQLVEWQAVLQPLV
jgi:hypothetical protein